MTPTSQQGTDWRPSVRPSGSGADWDNARQWFRTRSENEWVAFFADNPDVQAAILGDIYREVKAQNERLAGKPRIGRRPKVINGSLDELYGMITPRFAMEPFAASVRVLIDEARGLRALARKASMPHPTLLRMIRGTVPLEMWRLEAIARAGGVAPSYFKEWREGHVLTTIADLLESQPHLSVKLSKALVAAQQRSDRRVR